MILKSSLTALVSCCLLLSCTTRDEEYFNKHYLSLLMNTQAPHRPFYWHEMEDMGFKPDFTFTAKPFEVPCIDGKVIKVGSRRVAVFHHQPSPTSKHSDKDTAAWYFDAETLELDKIKHFEYHGVSYTLIDEKGNEIPIRCDQIDEDEHSP